MNLWKGINKHMGKKEQYYTNIMDALSLVHRENVYIINLLGAITQADEKKLEIFTEGLDKEFNNIRSNWTVD